MSENEEMNNEELDNIIVLTDEDGKDVEFEMVGDTTEVDKNIIEHISDPLMHLVRNSVDHGIETAEERAAKGKTEKTLSLPGTGLSYKTIKKEV